MLRCLVKSTPWRGTRYSRSRVLPSVAQDEVRSNGARWSSSAKDDHGSEATSPKRKRGRPRKNVESPGEIPSEASTRTAKAKRAGPSIPAGLIVQRSLHHCDLASFLEYTSSIGADPDSTTYRGTHYEYTVAAALHSFGFQLQRTGGSNDLGIDLVGALALPSSSSPDRSSGRAKETLSSSAPFELRVIGQCKISRPEPRMVRELEGAYVGAPAGWKGQHVLALLVSHGSSTKGVRDALQRSRWPLALLQVTAEGWLKQFLWNAAAAEAGLEGLGVTARHSGADADEGRHTIALTWMGEPVRLAG
ncbi:uncharacterized protein LTR77_000612 [Saxophila tyrrhenica]|uniref:Required for respiratory growth protein 7, mitochondrial n=1 Tax=Saxophila tyrrhenica TaxID=1690608 RepID=A0AAV9PQF4_9PEZI|nr:hypothetical protein LTR77_000612 [Saxophila tyrrhenica]